MKNLKNLNLLLLLNFPFNLVVGAQLGGDPTYRCFYAPSIYTGHIVAGDFDHDKRVDDITMFSKIQHSNIDDMFQIEVVRTDNHFQNYLLH